MMNGLIQQIKRHENIEEIYMYVKQRLFSEGPISVSVLEILSYMVLYTPDYFDGVKDEVLEMMGVFYKKPKPTTLQSVLFDMYGGYIKEQYGAEYTPVQANIIKGIKENKNFSFSAPTSTGKSFVFRNLIEASNKDVVIIVPSRALINEYYDRICDLIKDKTTNILTFVDIINTKHAKRSVFILTPERAKELFKFKEQLDIEFILFDEAQLGNEESVRGLYFDSIVRRVQKSFSNVKCVFAHPFVSNPDAQLLKNNFDINESIAFQFRQKNVGQIFYAQDGNVFYHFGIEKNLMGNQKVMCGHDPIMRALQNAGSVLIYVTKASIYDKSVFERFSKYITTCAPLTDIRALEMIAQLKRYIGASESGRGFYNSNMLENLKKGIVIHHGSLPLQARLILEHFTQQGFCRICFATSTLEQGINMPFDVVYLDTFQASKPLSLKNLIGRAGRSTNNNKFDYGCVVVKQANMSAFRSLMLQDEELSNVSRLDIQEDELGEEYKEFKEAINNDEYSDDYNLTNVEVERLRSTSIESLVKKLLDTMFRGNLLIPLSDVNNDQKFRLALYDNFILLYRYYLNGRQLSDGEESVLNTAIKILLWKVHCKTFKDICWYRYGFVARVPERRALYKQGRSQQADQLPAKFIRGYDDLPNVDLHNFSIYPEGTKATKVDYDRIVFDTYDYLDKLIGFKLSDIFYAIFYQHYEKVNDLRALKLAKYFKYGTDNEDEIWMLRYGFSFEDIEWVKDCIVSIGQKEIMFNDMINILSEHQYKIIERFVP